VSSSRGRRPVGRRHGRDPIDERSVALT